MSGNRYWDQVADRWLDTRPQRVWRAYADLLNAEWCGAWLPAEPVGRLLKTDLFDEVASEGLAPMLARHARLVVGIDVSRRMLEGARGAPLARVGADVTRLPFTDGAFDRVVSNSTLDHFGSEVELQRALGELARVLRPGGELLLTLDNMANPLLAVRNALPALERLGLIPYRMGTSCRPRRLRALCTSAGLEPLELSTLMHCPRALAVAVSAMLDRHSSERARARFFQGLLAFETLGRWPSRTLTGYFLALRARRPG